MCPGQCMYMHIRTYMYFLSIPVWLLQSWSHFFIEGTLFHLLAQFGLKKIAQQILSLPDAREGAAQLDHKGCLPEEVAEREGHSELSKLFVRSAMDDW